MSGFCGDGVVSLAWQVQNGIYMMISDMDLFSVLRELLKSTK